VFLDACIVDEDVESAEEIRALRDQLTHLSGDVEIRLQRRALATKRRHLRQRFVGASRIAVVVDDNIGAFAGEANRDFATDPLAAACDECLLAFERHS
jgi:hypothetical protein